MHSAALLKRAVGGSRLASLALACLVLARTAAAGDLIVPGGARGVSTALGIPAIDRARLLPEIVRIVYAPPSGRLDSRVMQDRLILYLDGLSRLQIELPLVQPRGGSITLASIAERSDRRQAATFFETLGLKLVDRNRSLTVAPAGDKDPGEYAALFAALGLEANAVVGALNAGEAVRFDLDSETITAPFDVGDLGPIVFGKALPPEQVFTAMLRDRRTALFAAALTALDDGTLQYLLQHPRLLERLHGSHPGPFYAFGASVRIRDGRVRPPGADGEAALWEHVVGERTTEPDKFLDALFGKSAGRLAYLYDAIAGLDQPHAAFALGTWLPDESRRAERFRALAAAVQGAYSNWDVDGRPSQRMASDVAMLLAVVRVGPDGAPQPPAWRQLWERAFAAADLPDDPARDLKRLTDDGIVDAAWLVERLALGLESDRVERMHTFAFGQRVFSSATAEGAADMLVALRAMARQPMLMLTLDRMGIVEPAVYAAAARTAVRITNSSRRDAYNGLGQYQSALAIVARLRRARVVTVEQASALVRDLVAPRPADRAVPPFAVHDWITGTLAAAIGADAGEFETGLDRALAGSGSAAPPASLATVVWEDRKYRVDLAAAELARISRTRERLAAPSLGDVTAFIRALEALAKGPATLDDAKKQLAALEAAAPVIRKEAIHPPGVDPLSNPPATLTKVIGRLTEVLRRPRDLKRIPGIVEPLVPVAQEALTSSLMALAYAVSLGAAQDVSGRGVNVARRHDFGFLLTGGEETRRRAAWRMATADPEPGKPWHVTGSLLGLDVGLSLMRLRRVTDLLPEPPTINANEARTLSRTIALINPFDLTDADRDGIVAALGRGRERIRALPRQPDGLDALARDLALDGRRVREISWVLRGDAERILEYFSLGEVLLAGKPDPGVRLDAWGAAAVPFTGCLCTTFDPPRWNAYTGRVSMGILAARLADVTLRLAELTAEAGLPAGILPDVLDAAMQDLIDRVRMIDDDDWLTLVRAAGAITRDRFDDLAAALTAAGGPLVPADQPVSGAAVRSPARQWIR